MDFSTGGIVASLFLGTIGMGFFVYGKKQARFPQLVGGLLLMVFPYFVGGAWTMLAIGAAIVSGIVFAVRTGH